MKHTKINILVAASISFFGVFPSSSASEHRQPACARLAVGSDAAVAIGLRNIIQFSNDGLTWITRIAPTESSLRAIAFGAGKFVTVGNEGVILTSTNGCHWTLQVSPTDERLRGIVFAKNLFVVVGYEGTVLTSR